MAKKIKGFIIFTITLAEALKIIKWNEPPAEQAKKYNYLPLKDLIP